MFRMLGAAAAALVLGSAGAASAAVTIFEATGTEAGEHLGFWGALPGPGIYEFEAQVSGSPDLINWYVDYDVHWDYYLAPAPQPHSASLLGNNSMGGTSFKSAGVFRFEIPDMTRVFSLAKEGEFRGVAAGTPVYLQTQAEKARYNFDVYDLSGAPFDYTVRISAVPEPATWAMLITGFGVAGAMIRRRRMRFALA